MSIIVVPSNRPPERFYRGAGRIATLRGEAEQGEYEPEDWIGSVTTVAGDDAVGLTTLPDGRRLVDAVSAEPEWWLGSEHVARYGDDTMLLVKLLDAGERLPVHAHPSRAFASEHLASAHGKDEAWFLLTGGSLHVGWRRDLTEDELRSLLERQDSAAILAEMHEVQVQAGDIVYVPAGVLHAIGAGLLLVELQEPADLSIMLEWPSHGLDGATEGHLGLGYDVALGTMERRARTPEEIATLVRPAGEGPSVLPTAADEFFRLERVRLDGEAVVDEGFAILIVVDGELQVRDADGTATLSRGSTAIVPHAAGALTLEGSADVVLCRPPR